MKSSRKRVTHNYQIFTPFRNGALEIPAGLNRENANRKTEISQKGGGIQATSLVLNRTRRAFGAHFSVEKGA